MYVIALIHKGIDSTTKYLKLRYERKDCKKERTQVYVRREWRDLRIDEAVKAGKMNQEQGLCKYKPTFCRWHRDSVCTPYNRGHLGTACGVCWHQLAGAVSKLSSPHPLSKQLFISATSGISLTGDIFCVDKAIPG